MGGNPDYGDWIDNNEAELRDAYIERLRAKDELIDVVFWWDGIGGKDEDRLRAFIRAREAYDNWIWGQYEEACSRAPEREEYEDR